MSESLLNAYVASAEFQDLLSGRLLWGDLVPPFPPSPPVQPTRDFSALAPRPGRNPFASLNKKREATAPAPGPEPSVPGWRPAEAEADDGGLYMCPDCDGVFQCYCFERELEEEAERGCEDCGGDPCRCCSGCYPGCYGCRDDFNPADPWDDGAPEEHPGWYPDDWSDDE